MIKLNTPYTIENADTVIFTEEKKDTIHGNSRPEGLLVGTVTLKSVFCFTKILFFIDCYNHSSSFLYTHIHTI